MRYYPPIPAPTPPHRTKFPDPDPTPRATTRQYPLPLGTQGGVLLKTWNDAKAEDRAKVSKSFQKTYQENKAILDKINLLDPNSLDLAKRITWIFEALNRGSERMVCKLFINTIKEHKELLPGLKAFMKIFWLEESLARPFYQKAKYLKDRM